MKELLSKARACKNAEELLALAEANGIELTAEEAEVKFAELNSAGALSDDELDTVNGGTGGACMGVGKTVTMIRDSCPDCGSKTAIIDHAELYDLKNGVCKYELSCAECQCYYSVTTFNAPAFY